MWFSPSTVHCCRKVPKCSGRPLDCKYPCPPQALRQSSIPAAVILVQRLFKPELAAWNCFSVSRGQLPPPPPPLSPAVPVFRMFWSGVAPCARNRATVVHPRALIECFFVLYHPLHVNRLLALELPRTIYKNRETITNTVATRAVHGYYTMGAPARNTLRRSRGSDFSKFKKFPPRS